MIIKKLEVAGLRAFTQATFDFQPGMNLLVGVNGMGKTTVLDALCICLSIILPQISASRSKKRSFSTDDIRIGTNALSVNCNFALEGNSFKLILHKQGKEFVDNPFEDESAKNPILDTPDIEEINPNIKDVLKIDKRKTSQSLGVFFSTRRSLLSNADPTQASAAGGQAAAFAESLLSRELNLKEIAYWMQAQEGLSKERPLTLKHLEALRYAADQFLPECKNLRAETKPQPKLTVEKNGQTLDIRQLSDGERSMLALVLDLARRLSQANPTLDNPVREGVAVVLIDELDLHLHPKWQRTIVERLTSTFPKCQFIATTHSPQIIPSVEPERVLLLTQDGVIHPDRTLGMDTNWILRNIMETDDRPEWAMEAIEDIENLINEAEFEEARKKIDSFRKSEKDLPEWSIFEARMARLEILEEE